MRGDVEEPLALDVCHGADELLGRECKLVVDDPLCGEAQELDEEAQG